MRKVLKEILQQSLKGTSRFYKAHQIGKPPNQGIEKRKLLCRVRWRLINISRRLSIELNYCWKHFQSIVKSLTSFLFVGLQRFWRILKSEATSRESSSRQNWFWWCQRPTQHLSDHLAFYTLPKPTYDQQWNKAGSIIWWS